MQQQKNLPRVVIAATQSSSGKTTLVTGLLRALRNKHIIAQPFKIGPDYIDPSYHSIAAGRRGHNLDSWLVDADKIPQLLVEESEDASIAIIEGVMGLYDGGKNGISSTAQIAKLIQAPVILVINCRSMGDSAAAVALGFKNYDPTIHLAGVILNGLGSASHYQMIATALERLQIPVLGAIYRDEALHLPERHLGLTPTDEADMTAKIDYIGDKISHDLDINTILSIANSAPPLTYQLDKLALTKENNIKNNITIAVAQDEAFNFYYPASLKVLEDLGARIIPFSPLHDTAIPQEADALMIGGGFPELFATPLAQNTSMLESIRQAHHRNLPIYAECGGFMYLMRGITDFDGKFTPLVNIIPATASMQKKLQTVGYVEARALRDCLIAKKDDLLRGHEFHFSIQDDASENFEWAFEMTRNRTQKQYLAGYSKNNLVASYLHMHFLGNINAAKRFIEMIREHKLNTN